MWFTRPRFASLPSTFQYIVEVRIRINIALRTTQLTVGADGAALALSEITSTPLFRSEVFPDAQTTFGIQDATASFSLLSQGEHPTTGVPCWYLHPCHTEQVVGEIMHEVQTDDTSRDLRWLEAWFMVVGNVIDWRAGSSGA